MDPLEKIRITIAEEGWSPEMSEHIANLMDISKVAQQEGAAQEKALKDLWWDAYQRGDVDKHWERDDGLKVDCRDAGKPKKTTTPMRLELAEDAGEAYDLNTLISAGILVVIPATTTTAPGSKGGVAITLPKRRS